MNPTTRARRLKVTYPRRPEAVLQEVVAVPLDVPGADDSGSAPPLELFAQHLGRPSVLEVGPEGVVIDGPPSPVHDVPSLLPWSAVRGVTADRAVHLPGDVAGHLVEIEVEDGWQTGAAHPGPLQFVGSDADLEPIMAAVPFRGSSADTPWWKFRHTYRRHARRIRTGRSLRSLARLGVLGHRRHRIATVAVAMGLLILAAGGASSPPFLAAAGGASTPSTVARTTHGNGHLAASHPASNLPAATSAPEPAPPSLAGSPPLAQHEIFGYAPYWTLPESSGFDLQDLTTLAYFSVDANADGSLDESGPGWNGYESQDLVNLVSRAHQAGDRVVLTVTCFSQSSLDAITSDPTAPSRLAAALIAAVSAKNLDGVNFDFEGEGSADQAGLTSLITQVSADLRAANSHWQVTMATYASAAGDPNGFYNIAALAPAVDAFFVMAYDMNDPSSPSATSPLVGGSFNDTEALRQYTSVVPASKVILGIPYYGYDWPTTDGTLAAQATGGESPLSDGVIAASGHPTYWDPSTDTAWTSYQVGGQWHETFFDNPTSLALKAQLANSFHIAGMGIWALGMDGNAPAMLAALLGDAPAVKDYTTGPTSTSASVTAPPGSGYTTTGVWDSTTVPLTAIAAPPPDGSAQFLGDLTSLTTNDPSLSCLQTGQSLSVWSFSDLPGVDVVVATQPPDCAAAVWTFPASDGPSSTTTTTTAPSSSTTTTTGPSSTTTTTTAPSSSTTTTTSPTSTTTTPSSTTTTTTASGQG